MDEKPLISVIVPVYNVEKFLDKCVQSIIGQTYENLEIILVDDGSSDKCGALCDAWAGKDARIKVIHKENGGISSARNAGLAIAKGDYIGFADSDDYIEPDMYEQLYARICRDRTQIAVCSFIAEYEDGTRKKRIFEDLPDGVLCIADYVAAIEENLRNQGTLVVVWNRLYDKKLLNGLEFREKVLHEDEFFFNSLLGRVERFSILHDAYYHYVQHGESIMNSRFRVGRIQLFNALKERIELLEQKEVSADTVAKLANRTVETGIRFYLLAYSRDLLMKDERQQFYKDIRTIQKRYPKAVGIKQILLWNTFRFMPGILCALYKAKKGKQD